ncbi:MAG: alpha/beta fold hydrolase [Proteobacteria bacterium]|nr:MAG: alpha/beta fold hydrolase [Pseudomonadota bacterium]
MTTLTVGDITVFKKEYGEGPALLGIMGLGANLDYWSPEILDSMSAYRHVIIFDNRGVSGTSRGTKAVTIAQMADDAIALLDELKIAKADVFGVSMGGMIAQEIAIRYPKRVQKLILCCTTPGPRHTKFSPAILGAFLAKKRSQILANLLFPKSFQKAQPEKVQRFLALALQRPVDETVLRLQLLSCSLFSSKSRLHRIKNQTLVLTGDSDILINKHGSYLIAGLIPNARLEVFPGGGHGVMLQNSEQIHMVIREFLTSQ